MARVESHSKGNIAARVLVPLKMKLKTDEGRFPKKLDKTLRRVLLAQGLDAGFNQLIH